MCDEKLVALATYFELMSLNGGARIFRCARETGVFDAVAAGQTSVQAVADACGTVEGPTGLLLEGLCALGVMRRKGGTYGLPLVMQFLAGNYQDLGDGYWDHLSELLKTGEPMARMDDAGQSEQEYVHQVTALAWMMKPAAHAATVALGIGTRLVGPAILDLGAGAAVWSLTMAQADCKAKVTAVDWPGVLELATAEAARLGLADRLITVPGNYHDVELALGIYDLAVIGNVTHLESGDGNLALLARVHAALKPGGTVVIFDVVEGQQEGDLARALYKLGLALRTTSGHVYSYGELAGFLKSSGFVSATLTPLAVPPYTMGMVTAQKED